MKRLLIAALLLAAACVVASAQANGNKGSKAGKSSVEDTIISMEKQAWEAWKNKNGAFFQSFATDDSVLVSGSGIEGKAASIQSITNSQCVVKGYSLDNFKTIMVNKDTALLTYSAKQDAVCNGKPLPQQVWASSIFVKRNGKWLNLFHQETAAEPGM